MRLRILTTVSVGLLAAACQNTTNTSGISAATGSGLYASSNQACVDYGFVPNTAAYSRNTGGGGNPNLKAERAFTSEIGLSHDGTASVTYYGGQGTGQRLVVQRVEQRGRRQIANRPQRPGWKRPERKQSRYGSCQIS